MTYRHGAAGAFIIVALCFGSDLLACGDKFLSVGRGTRYQRPKNARAAAVLIYAAPGSGLPAVLKDVRADLALKREGHRATIVETPEQLTAILKSGRFDVIVAATSVGSVVELLVGSAPDRPIVVTLDPRPKPGSLIEAIDRAVERHDQNIKKVQSRL